MTGNRPVVGAMPESSTSFQFSSPALTPGEVIPVTFTDDAEGDSPPLAFANIPAGTRTLAVCVYDADARFTQGRSMWLLWNIPPAAQVRQRIERGWRVPELGLWARQGRSWRGQHRYAGPLLPQGARHHIVFFAAALPVVLDLPFRMRYRKYVKVLRAHAMATSEFVVLSR